MEETFEDFDAEFPNRFDRIFARKSTVTVKGKQSDIRIGRGKGRTVIVSPIPVASDPGWEELIFEECRSLFTFVEVILHAEVELCRIIFHSNHCTGWLASHGRRWSSKIKERKERKRMGIG